MTNEAGRKFWAPVDFAVLNILLWKRCAVSQEKLWMFETVVWTLHEQVSFPTRANVIYIHLQLTQFTPCILSFAKSRKTLEIKYPNCSAKSLKYRVYLFDSIVTDFSGCFSNCFIQRTYLRCFNDTQKSSEMLTTDVLSILKNRDSKGRNKTKKKKLQKLKCLLSAFRILKSGTCWKILPTRLSVSLECCRKAQIFLTFQITVA